MVVGDAYEVSLFYASMSCPLRVLSVSSSMSPPSCSSGSVTFDETLNSSRLALGLASQVRTVGFCCCCCCCGFCLVGLVFWFFGVFFASAGCFDSDFHLSQCLQGSLCLSLKEVVF